MTDSPSLTEFLLSCIAEDERVAARKADRLLAMTRPDAPIATTDSPFSPTRVLAECEAKRRIVEMQAANDEDRYLPGFHYKAQMIGRVLRVLALSYADHPDYREEWKL